MNFTKWVRGTESLTLYSPRPTPSPLKLIGLGGSAPGNIRANAIVVRSFDELDAMKDQVQGKIVVYNAPWINYGSTVAYRVAGASRASKYGAVAALVRSVTPDSIESVHTGIQFYDSAYPEIPVAAITKEDAEMFQRMQVRNQTITLHLVMESVKVEGANSSNLIFEIEGSTQPDKILLMGGHIDSWDTGSQTGANDDGGGFITIFEAMRLIKKNGLRPKRTLRFIAWSGEEWGDPRNGAQQYALNHKDELANHIVAFENDLGSTRLLGFGYNGPEAGLNIIKSIAANYMSIINATLVNDEGHGSDTSPLYSAGVPVMANSVYDTPDHEFYFTYHHSAGDSMSIMNADDMDSNVLGIAAMFYILADLDNTLPRATDTTGNLRSE